jgi:uncharacterized protein YdhG (YjbR/CyaY superfamily)
MEKTKSSTIDEYLALFPEAVRTTLEELRRVIHYAAPEAREVISYGMPAFKLKTVLVYFAAYPRHIGFYPTASGIEAFKPELSGYEFSKGAIRFPLDQPLPFDLITRIVKFRVAEVNSKLP